MGTGSLFLYLALLPQKLCGIPDIFPTHKIFVEREPSHQIMARSGNIPVNTGQKDSIKYIAGYLIR